MHSFELPHAPRETLKELMKRKAKLDKLWERKSALLREEIRERAEKSKMDAGMRVFPASV